ncbi:NUMOD4 motif-containing HNH endonuclease [Pseudomonas aeruginosa]|uniref:NUMOD4 motif-containing HNH endonuclease n=1 Tax=Pseudomonas aeruginosa TaxID=287 RepID=UPI00249F57E9|nr:NUMOD4 motif-containing HNH endonuclease [Pseudomonas aeruginosa]WGY37373.1 NUMOD4 motif-containing HNH endonuclease [Pseudomonas aeruginosa]
MSEIWKCCAADDGYEVSNLGRVRSKDRQIIQGSSSRAKAYSRRMPGRDVKPFVSRSTGYLQVNLGGKKRHNVHRLVATAFCQGFDLGLVVNHKNGVRDDNRAENLEWVTQAENNKHAFDVLGRAPSTLGKFGADSPADKGVTRIDLATGEERRYGSAMDAVREGFDSGAISNCCNGRQKTHRGFAWKFTTRDYWEAA